MPTVRGYLNGMSAGQAGPGCPPDLLKKRGRITGWTQGAVRRHTRWLYSVDAERLATDVTTGVALTLTMRDCPATPQDFERARRAWIERLSRAHVVRLHWVVEWQARGVPHIHAAAYFPAGVAVEIAEDAIADWLAVAGRFGAQPQAQAWNAIDGALGWLQYLSKHAARGVAHYQRQGKPEAWETTGRLWGHRGEWPTVEPMQETVSWEAYWRLRRLVRRWRIADARKALRAARNAQEARQARRRIAYARRMLACPDPRLSRVRGLSEWLPIEHLVPLLEAVGPLRHDEGAQDPAAYAGDRRST